MSYKTFEELEVYKAAREFRKEIYRLIKKLPTEEKYNLAGQMRRAALSLTNNVTVHRRDAENAKKMNVFNSAKRAERKISPVLKLL